MMQSGTGPESDAALVRAHADFLARPEFQTTLPTFRPPETPHWMVDLGAFLVRHWTVIRWALWVVLALLLLFVVYSLVRAYWPSVKLRSRRPRPAPAAPPVAWRPAPAAARELLKESDELAARGLYGEAVHLLLLRSIADIEGQRPHLLRRAFTSREIGRLDALPEAARRAFAGMAAVVERALFAGAAVDAADFDRCRRTYEAFAFPAVWRTDGAR